MKIYEKIGFMRQLKGWSQEEMAEQLQMSPSGYAKIERGETDIQISRLEQIAKSFDVDLIDLLSFGDKNVVYVTGDNNHQIQNLNFSQEATAFEIKRLQLIIEHLKETISLKDEIIATLKKY
jgi:transcriptional regulator with XRE-family HTH domain